MSANPNNGHGTQAVPSDLEAVFAKVEPERRADFLRWRERLNRHDDNDEMLALAGYLDTTVVLMDLIARQAQPEAIAKALAEVKQTSKDQAAATARIPPLSFCLNAAAIIVPAVLGIVMGGLIMWGYRNHVDDEREQTPAAQVIRNLGIIGGSIRSDVSQTGHMMTIRISPGSAWKIMPLSPTLPAEPGAVTLYDPRPGQ